MREMTRREFFRESFGIIVSASLLKNFRFSDTNSRVSTEPKSDLIIAHNGTPKELLTAALERFGGIGTVVKKDQNVVIKVNISFNRAPDKAATTNPELVKTLVQACFDAGASDVLVLDHTIENPEMCADSTGMEEAVKRAGGKIKTINSKRDYERTEVPEGRTLKWADISTDVLNADVFINVPIAKVHNSAVTTVSMKNLMGTVWDRGEFHRRGLHQCIADLSTCVKPDLIVLDAYRILMTHGPGGPGEVKDAGEVVIGTDPVAVDVYGSLLLGKNPDDVRYIVRAADLGVGCMDMDEITTVYVDAQQKPTKHTETKKPVESPTTQESPAEKWSETAPPEIPSEEPGSEEHDAGILPIILLPAIIVSLLIGLRLRKKEDNAVE
jgi:uncharacterized protein (DUF362 family)